MIAVLARLFVTAMKFRCIMGSLQLEILKVLWLDGPATVAEVHARLADRTELAYTTVATVLRKMELRGLVRHKGHGRRFIYEAAVAECDVVAELAGDVLDRVFEGRLTDMVNHLLTTQDVSVEELDALAKLIVEQRRKKK